MSTAWNKRQQHYFVTNQHLTDAEMASEVSKVGPKRSIQSIRNKRKREGLQRTEVQRAEVHVRRMAIRHERPVSLAGFNPEKDAAFVRLLVTEGLRCGALKVAA